MIKKNDGHIVSIASVAGLTGGPKMVDYSSSKFGAVGLMEALRTEMKHKNININVTTICPYIVNTGMFDGAKTSVLFPILDQDHVINRSVNAIL